MTEFNYHELSTDFTYHDRYPFSDCILKLFQDNGFYN